MDAGTLSPRSVLSAAIGDEAREGRLRRLFAAHSLPSSQPTLYNHQLNLPRGSIWISSSEVTGLNLNDAWVTLDGHSCFVFDIGLDQSDGAVIPMNPRVPYAGTSRSEAALQYTPMLPTFFIRRTDGAAGIPITAPPSAFMLANLINADEQFDVPRTSLKVKFSWPGYRHISEVQIQYGCRTGGGLLSITVGRLAGLVAGAVRTFLHRAEGQWAYDPTHRVNDPYGFWRVGGRGVPGICGPQLFLVGVVFVSPGAITPILQLQPQPSHVVPTM